MKKINNKGFTLAELLIVVAIIAVLVAVSIPVFTTQLEKSREAVDAANIRAAYAEVMTEVLTGDTVGAHTVTLKQQTDGWQNVQNSTGLTDAGMVLDGTPKSGGTCSFTYPTSGTNANKVVCTFSS